MNENRKSVGSENLSDGTKNKLVAVSSTSMEQPFGGDSVRNMFGSMHNVL